jgi:translocator protein
MTGDPAQTAPRPAWQLAVLFAPAILLLGFLSGRIAGSGPGNAWFDALEKPAIYPPAAAFGIVWSVLYVLMGIALARVVTAREAPLRKAAIALFAAQLVANLAWSPLFFGAHRIAAALVLLVVLDALVVATAFLFWRIRRAAGALLLPYLAWVLFATALNWAFLAANPALDGA